MLGIHQGTKGASALWRARQTGNKGHHKPTNGLVCQRRVGVSPEGDRAGGQRWAYFLVSRKTAVRHTHEDLMEQSV